ncbi:MAG: hypothetical protein E6772_03155 [Dysgonomonas sp.]|nr:hypothetical protein [Dysgonomonas sp.]
MDKLKSAIADKVLEISSSDEGGMKAKLEKINRFRDFVNACQTLIRKYPEIETELLQMVENDDFDAKIASSRVDSIIRLSENIAQNPQSHETVEEDISQLDEITEHLVEEEEKETTIIETESGEVLKESPFIYTVEEEPIHYQPEDIDYEEVEPLALEEDYAEKEREYVDFEEVAPSEIIEEPSREINEFLVKESYREPTIEAPSSIKPQVSAVKDNAKKGLQLLIVIIAIIAIIFIIVFVIRNLEAVLWGTGIGIVVIGIAWILIKKKKNEEE